VNAADPASPNEDLSAELKAELVNFQGDSAVQHIVRWRHALWFSEPREPWRELLAGRLASGWLNIAEVVRGQEVTNATTPTGEPRGPFSKPLIRLGQTYVAEELIVKDNDAAIAGELAFCLWVRRRDPHAWNRVYIGGVPIFFDQHVAFDTRSLDEFFEPGGDGSYPSRWRVRTFPSADFVPSTQGERDAARPIAWEIGLHRVRNQDDFKRSFDAALTHIADLEPGWVAEQVRESGVPSDIAAFLQHTRAEMLQATERLFAVLFVR
jgi:hypothetical protein